MSKVNRNIRTTSRENVEAEAGLFDALKQINARDLDDRGMIDRAEVASYVSTHKIKPLKTRKSTFLSDKVVSEAKPEVAVVLAPPLRDQKHEHEELELPALELTTIRTYGDGKETSERRVIPILRADDNDVLTPVQPFTWQDFTAADEIINVYAGDRQSGILGNLSDDYSRVKPPNNAQSN